MNAAIAGPPLVTDDTGTASQGVLEVIAYAAGESRDAGESVQGPAAELDDGLGEDLEISLTIPRQRAKDAGQPAIKGWGARGLSAPQERLSKRDARRCGGERGMAGRSSITRSATGLLVP